MAFHSYLPEFVAKTESERNPLPCSFLVKSFSDFTGDLEERFLSPIRDLKFYFYSTFTLSPRLCSVFVSPQYPSLSNNVFSLFLLGAISGDGAGGGIDSRPLRAQHQKCHHITCLLNWVGL